MVRSFLRGQNLEQLGRADEAAAMYEQAIAGGFDSTGPYDRLITLYGHRGRHHDVIRVAAAALSNVRTYEEKRAWYVRMRDEARKASGNVPEAAPKGSRRR